ncbi:MAG: hypothetical protein HUK18_04705 [Bacteroidales bacterium]|nr:hypothetical protein [Bacteroidales bacterium]
MKRYFAISLFCVALGFMFGSCSKDKADEDLIKVVLNDYYHCINNKDFKKIYSLVSPNMKTEIDNMKNISAEMVVFPSFNITDIDVNGERAKAIVSSTDEFGNTVSLVWNMIKVKGEWKVNNYNTSKASRVRENN